ncbi:unnamed protein product [Caenorhabditis angaria]|uniref:Coatomer alpha subunit C-terminal domain-containing protein n=1 Tax=Caenorhabditis angaria TaxID=860376 RepID=A0A9P1MWW7_9PELO|nr:unnamed protein product [Caenorhabditis angaria]
MAKYVFARVYGTSRLSHCGWGGLGPVGPIYIHHSIRNYQEEKNPLSVVAVKLSILAKKLQKSYNLTTSRKFGDAIVKLRESHLAICSTFDCIIETKSSRS